MAARDQPQNCTRYVATANFPHTSLHVWAVSRRPQMWERAQVGFGGTERKRKGPCTKQCAWRKHGSSDTRLAEACPPKLRNTAKYRVEEMRPKWPFWKHRAPKMRPPEALLPRNPTWESPHFSGLAKFRDKATCQTTHSMIIIRAQIYTCSLAFLGNYCLNARRYSSSF